MWPFTVTASAGASMACGRLLLRRAPPASTPSLLKTISRFQSSSSPTHSARSLEPHDFGGPCQFLGSWAPPGDPEEAQKKLALLRREYKKQVKQVRAGYWYEMELQRQERQRKDEARREKARVEREARKAEKAAAAQSRAAERKVLEEEFRDMLAKERAEKLAYWKSCEAKREQKKNEKKELIRRQSSVWFDEHDLHKRALEAVVNTTSL